MPFALMPLPFEKNALEPIISANTLDYHHGKHHAAYVDKVNELIEGDSNMKGASLVKIVKAARLSDNRELYNNAAQCWNHNFYWSSLTPEGDDEPSGKLAELISSAFDSTAKMLEKMREEAKKHFSNGWVWLLLEGGALTIKSFHDADTPLVFDDAKPLFTLDIWEHAYYIDYHNDRPEYADAALGNLVNWTFVAQNLDGQGAARADQEPA